MMTFFDLLVLKFEKNMPYPVNFGRSLNAVFLTISQTEKSHGKQTKQTTFFQKNRPKTDHFFRKLPKKQTYINVEIRNK